MIHCTPLGQSGFRFQYKDCTFFIDPYLSNSVELIEGSHQTRQVPIALQPDMVADADYVLITHIHLDHCDLETLLPIAKSSEKCKFIGPNEVCRFLITNGFDPSRVILAPKNWMTLGSSINIHITPAAHPVIEVDDEKQWKYIGYIIEFDGKKLYHAGDTFLTDEVIRFVKQFMPISVAMLPINEHNFARNQLGILGNMSVRDAFEMARLLNVDTLVPIHWDMFRLNGTYREEIELYYGLTRPSFNLQFNPTLL